MARAKLVASKSVDPIKRLEPVEILNVVVETEVWKNSLLR